ncbi:TlpA family protein disulfide reductase [Aromatoleum petrolei]|uniref:Redoxin family protein n=1 Tax=Aromatoleum petrolei TaxID=76116 RepID=A0ABX1MTE1_9RHOO|nr:TlpA disulfide reductase family protein [Aromatoleum petrolei]NMF91220.1 redoxin family protein [Aromatoleum petrolei]QTQ37427.1 Thioredoxin-like protein [Aromatoleum petrolei]
MKNALVSLALCFAAVPGSAVATPGEVSEGGTLQQIPMQGLTGGSKLLGDYRGKPLIINVWASYCPPCLAEMSSLERLSKRYGKQFNVIGVSIDDYPDRAQAFLVQAKTSFPHFIDRRLALENMLGADRIPLTVLVDADGKILRKVYGAKGWDSPETVEAIGKAFGLRM